MCEEFLLKDESPVTVGGNLVKAESLHAEEEELQASPVLLFQHLIILEKLRPSGVDHRLRDGML